MNITNNTGKGDGRAVIHVIFLSSLDEGFWIDDTESDSPGYGSSGGGYLTFVHSCISVLCVFNLNMKWEKWHNCVFQEFSNKVSAQTIFSTITAHLPRTSIKLPISLKKRRILCHHPSPIFQDYNTLRISQCPGFCLIREENFPIYSKFYKIPP